MTNRGYRIVVAQPGYLPEMEPYDCEDLAHARTCLADEVHLTDAGFGDCGSAHLPGYEDAMRSARTFEGDGCAIPFGGYVHEAIPLGTGDGC